MNDLTRNSLKKKNKVGNFGYRSRQLLSTKTENVGKKVLEVGNFYQTKGKKPAKIKCLCAPLLSIKDSLKKYS
ncbi:MAG: hypothetical protein ACNYPH_02180 [Gammaproteobacteria bacterium WSBS_2016_MAG_OTU1]